MAQYTSKQNTLVPSLGEIAYWPFSSGVLASILYSRPLNFVTVMYNLTLPRRPLGEMETSRFPFFTSSLYNSKRSGAIWRASTMKTGSANGVRAGELAPLTIYVLSFLRFSSRAWPTSVSTRLLACIRYKTSGLGGTGPEYFSSELNQAAVKHSKAIVRRNVCLRIVIRAASSAPSQQIFSGEWRRSYSRSLPPTLLFRSAACCCLPSEVRPQS